jgi:predicted membrane protein (TIGR00267 family)
MLKRIELFNRYLLASGAYEIARRLFVMNAFDGTLTILGVVVGAHMSGASDPHVVITAGIGGSVAMGISGVSGAYLAERAERLRDLRKLEVAMLTDLEDTHFAKASKLATLVIALVDGISPAICAIILILPYLLVPIISLEVAFYVAVVTSLLLLFMLGIFLARISEEMALLSGLRMVLVGIITILIVGTLVPH